MKTTDFISTNVHNLGSLHIFKSEFEVVKGKTLQSNSRRGQYYTYYNLGGGP